MNYSIWAIYNKTDGRKNSTVCKAVRKRLQDEK